MKLTSKKLIVIITIAVCAIALLATSLVFASTKVGGDDIVRDTTSIESSENETIIDDIPNEKSEPETTETDDEESTVETGETDDTTTSATTNTTTNTTPNYNPTQNISGQADVVKNEEVPNVTVVVDNEDTSYEDEDVDAVILPTVVTPETTFGGKDTTTTTSSTTSDTVRTDVVTPPAMDDNTVEEEVVGVELEEVKEDEMPDFLP